MAGPTITVMAAGAMGAAIARRLTQAGCIVLTNLDGRSQGTRDRAQHAGMLDVSYQEIVTKSDWILSILPPSEAFNFAQKIVDTLASANITGSPQFAYADCNAVNPITVKKIARLFEDMAGCTKFIDAGIIGGPPKEGYDPTIYASASPENATLLERFGSFSQYGLKIELLTGDGVGVGDASALKMSYSGIAKGVIGLFSTMILAAHTSSPATASALLRELKASQPKFIQMIIQSIPDMIPKAYRWVGEMAEISAFVGGGEADIHRGMESLYRRIERSREDDGEDVAVLEQFIEDARKICYAVVISED